MIDNKSLICNIIAEKQMTLFTPKLFICRKIDVDVVIMMDRQESLHLLQYAEILCVSSVNHFIEDSRKQSTSSPFIASDFDQGLKQVQIPRH